MKTEEIKKEITDLCTSGWRIYFNEVAKQQPDLLPKTVKVDKNASLHSEYQIFYLKALRVIKTFAPERYNEFRNYYEIDPKRKDIVYDTYKINDYLIGTSVTRGGVPVFDTFGIFGRGIQIQLTILESIKDTIDSRLANIEKEIEANIFDRELYSAKTLNKGGYIRSAGAICGVILESHLSTVCANHGITFRKNNPTISDFYEALKKDDIIDTPTWRLLQRLGDIRNYCVHKKERDPTADEVNDLLINTDKIIHELF